MRGRALRPLTSVSLSSDSLYDFIALLVVNPENQEAMNDSMKQSPANLGGWQGQAGSNRKKKTNKRAPLYLRTVSEEKRIPERKATLVLPTSCAGGGGARKLPINRARFSSGGSRGECQMRGGGGAKTEQKPSSARVRK